MTYKALLLAALTAVTLGIVSPAHADKVDGHGHTKTHGLWTPPAEHEGADEFKLLKAAIVKAEAQLASRQFDYLQRTADDIVSQLKTIEEHDGGENQPDYQSALGVLDTAASNLQSAADANDAQRASAALVALKDALASAAKASHTTH